MEQQNNLKKLTVSILSLSLLTVMAGAAVAPALGSIKQYFINENPLFVQMIISMPSLFIILTNLIFPKLCARFGSKTLVLTGLMLYTAGGCIAGLFNNIFLLLLTRALVGVGVGIIMPLSTGLLSFYFAPEAQDKLMGYSSAMNQLGGAVATLFSGLLASISWRFSFFVYALGLISIVLCIFFLPNDKIAGSTHENSCEESSEHMKASTGTSSIIRENIFSIAAIFLLMVTFFIYPANFAMIASQSGIIPHNMIAIIMSGMDIIAFIGGLSFVSLKKLLAKKIRFLAPCLFLAGYLLLSLGNSAVYVIAGSVLIGFANGVGIPCIISHTSQKVGKNAASSIMPLLSAAFYGGQFFTPFITSLVSAAFSGGPLLLPYYIAVFSSVLFALASSAIK